MEELASTSLCIEKARPFNPFHVLEVTSCYTSLASEVFQTPGDFPHGQAGTCGLHHFEMSLHMWAVDTQIPAIIYVLSEQ